MQAFAPVQAFRRNQTDPCLHPESYVLYSADNVDREVDYSAGEVARGRPLRWKHADGTSLDFVFSKAVVLHQYGMYVCTYVRTYVS